VSLLASKLVLVLPFSARREYVSTVMSTRVRSSTPTQTILNWMLPSPHWATPHHPVTVTVLTVHMLNFEFSGGASSSELKVHLRYLIDLLSHLLRKHFSFHIAAS
jgi:hypothetical protein